MGSPDPGSRDFTFRSGPARGLRSPRFREWQHPRHPKGAAASAGGEFRKASATIREGGIDRSIEPGSVFPAGTFQSAESIRDKILAANPDASVEILPSGSTGYKVIVNRKSDVANMRAAGEALDDRGTRIQVEGKGGFRGWNQTRADQFAAARSAKDEKVARALTMSLQGKSLFQIGQELGVSKEWLRAYAGISASSRKKPPPPWLVQ